MAECPNCKERISWLRFLLMVLVLDNSKALISCKNCKAILKPKHWFLWGLSIGLVLFGLAVAFFFLTKQSSVYIKFIFAGIWVLMAIFSPVVFMFAEYKEI